jgi:hypothetical protein
VSAAAAAKEIGAPSVPLNDINLNIRLIRVKLNQIFI